MLKGTRNADAARNQLISRIGNYLVKKALCLFAIWLKEMLSMFSVEPATKSLYPEIWNLEIRNSCILRKSPFRVPFRLKVLQGDTSYLYLGESRVCELGKFFKPCRTSKTVISCSERLFGTIIIDLCQEINDRIPGSFRFLKRGNSRQAILGADLNKSLLLQDFDTRGGENRRRPSWR